ncbi:MAG: LLM class flavin-dependent oxidoreductase [Dehalococcoidia bacterium]
MLTKGKTRFGIAVPQMFPDGSIDVALISQHLKQAESLGYESAWVQDQVTGDMPTLEPFTLLPYASTVTAKMKLGISVLVMPYRSPIHLAKISATVDRLSQGRLILGIGIGGGEDRYPAFGFTPEHRVTRFEEGIQLMKRLWAESKVDFQGRFWQMEKVTIKPKPLQKPHPPIWFGAHAPAALNRAVKMGDGWMGAGSSSLRAFKESLKNMREYLAQDGRDPSTFPLAKRVYIAVDRDKEGAERKLRKWFAGYYGDGDLAVKVAFWGPEEEVIDRLGTELMTEDLDLIMFNPVYDLVDQAAKLAEDIVPKL